jgi:hypothetical protein
MSSGMGINLGDNLSTLDVANVLRPHLHRTTAMSKLSMLPTADAMCKPHAYP